MNCTHPVLYSRDCVLYCKICGAVVPQNVQTEKNPAETEKPSEGQKTGRKRKTRKETEQ
jgi:hypothetical protein